MIIGVLIANFCIDVAYVIDRPAHAGRDAGPLMAVSDRPPETATLPERADPGRPGADGSVDRARPAAAGRSSSISPAGTSKFVIGFCLVASMLVLAIVGPHADEPRAARLHRPDRRAAVRRVLVRDDLVRPGRLLPVRARAPRGVPGRRPRRRDRGRDRDGRRVHGRLPRRLDRRHPEHAHERRARDPDARDPDHRRRVPERAELCDRGGADRAHLVAVGGARDPLADLLAEDARVRRRRADQRPQPLPDHRARRSRRT